jgi:hypothetical protein
VARGNTRADILIFAFALVLVPPTLAALVELGLSRFGRVREIVHLLLVGLLVAAIGLQILDDLIDGSSALLIPVSLALGGAAAFAYDRGSVPGSILTLLSPAPLIFLFLFLVTSPVSKLVLPQDEADPATGAVTRDVPVVMVVFDELRVLTLMDGDHEIDARRFPNFAKLARHSTWYRNATTVADATTVAVPALLSGRVPKPDELPIRADHPRNLFTMLAGSYAMNVREAATALCPNDVCKRSSPPAARRLRSLAKDLTIVSLHRLLPDDLDSRLPAVDETFGNFGAGTVTSGVAIQDNGLVRTDRPADAERGKAVESWIRSLGRPSRKPTLDFLHIFLPHVPWQYLPSGRLYPDNGMGIPGKDRQVEGWGKDGWSDNAFLVGQAEQRFTLQAQYVDRLVGELLTRLRRSGLYDRALVIVTADHGASFHPGGTRRSVSMDTIGDIAGVPLFVKLPHQKSGGPDDSPARTVDVLPTIADVLGLKSGWEFDGVSLARAGSPLESMVSLSAFAGKPVTVSFDEFLRARDRELSRTITLLGTGDPAGIYRVGPHRELVGRSLAELDVGAAAVGGVLLDGVQQYASLNPAAQVLPAYLTGRLEGVELGAALAVAVNGRIRAVGSAFDLQGSTVMATLVPEDALRRGKNSIRVFEVRGSGDATTLEPLRQAATATYRLVRKEGADVIVSSEGQESRVVATQGGGFLEDATIEGGGMHASGWSASKSRGAATTVVAFVGGKFVAEAVPGTDRPDVAKLFGDDAERSGFQLNAQVPADAGGDADVRVFGIFGDSAVELQQ